MPTMYNGNCRGWNEANMTIRIITGWLLCVLTAAGGAAYNDLPPAYVPQQQVTGRIVIWGHGSLGNATDFVEGLTRAWEAGFGQLQPGGPFQKCFYGQC